MNGSLIGRLLYHASGCLLGGAIRATTCIIKVVTSQHKHKTRFDDKVTHITK